MRPPALLNCSSLLHLDPDSPAVLALLLPLHTLLLLLLAPSSTLLFIRMLPSLPSSDVEEECLLRLGSDFEAA
jgi:hypothetical protein